jgi:cell division topological specificity factor
MASFFERMLGRGPGRGSSSKAKERLQFILVHDRINLPPERLEAMKQDILAVISRYVAIDADNVDIALQRRQRDSLLVAEIPFTKTNEGIEQDDPEAALTPASIAEGAESEADDPDTSAETAAEPEDARPIDDRTD